MVVDVVVPIELVYGGWWIFLGWDRKKRVFGRSKKSLLLVCHAVWVTRIQI